MKTYRMVVIIERDKEGYYAYCPSLQGCYTQGETFEEALENLRDAVKLHLEDRLAQGEEIPAPEIVSFVNLEWE